MVLSLRKLVCIVMLAGCGDDATAAAPSMDAGDPCLTACVGDAGFACKLGNASYDSVLATFRAMCSGETRVFTASCENNVRGIVIGSGNGNTTVFFDSDGGQLGVRTDDEAVDPTCDGHGYYPRRIMCNGSISSTICSDAPVGSALP